MIFYVKSIEKTSELLKKLAYDGILFFNVINSEEIKKCASDSFLHNFRKVT